MKSSIGVKYYVDYVLVYLLLLFKAGFLFYEFYSAVSATILFLLLVIVMQARNQKLSSNQALVVIFIIGCQLLSYLFCGFPSINKAGLSLLNTITALLVVSVIPSDSFSRYFSNIILLICGVSLVGHILFILGIPLIQFLPTITNSKGHSVYFGIFAEFWMDASSGSYRLQGIFWEPGAFQAMIIFAALLDLYKNKPSNILLRFLCYALTLFFTYSTTGYICLLLLIILTIIKGKKMKLSLIFIILILAIGLSFGILKLINSLDGFLYFSMFGKLELLLDAFQYGDSNAATSRLDSVILPFKYFLNSPIFGAGENGFEQISQLVGHNMFTCTPVNYFAYYGFVCGVICLVGFINYIRLKSKSLVEAVVLILILILTTSSENFAFNSILTTFMLYGYSMHSSPV